MLEATSECKAAPSSLRNTRVKPVTLTLHLIWGLNFAEGTSVNCSLVGYIGKDSSFGIFNSRIFW